MTHNYVAAYYDSQSITYRHFFEGPWLVTKEALVMIARTKDILTNDLPMLVHKDTGHPISRKSVAEAIASAGKIDLQPKSISSTKTTIDDEFHGNFILKHEAQVISSLLRDLRKKPNNHTDKQLLFNLDTKNIKVHEISDTDLISRLEKIPHHGLPSNASTNSTDVESRPFSSRLDYLIGMLQVIDTLRDELGGYITTKKYPLRQYEILQLWAIISQIGHLGNAYISERYILWMLSKYKDSEENAENKEEKKKITENRSKLFSEYIPFKHTRSFNKLIDNEEWTNIRRIVFYVKLLDWKRKKRISQESLDLLMEMSDLLISKPEDDTNHICKLQDSFRIIRMLAYVGRESNVFSLRIKINDTKKTFMSLNGNMRDPLWEIIKNMDNILYESLYFDSESLTKQCTLLSAINDRYAGNTFKDIILDMYDNTFTLESNIFSYCFSLPIGRPIDNEEPGYPIFKEKMSKTFEISKYSECSLQTLWRYSVKDHQKKKFNKAGQNANNLKRIPKLEQEIQDVKKKQQDMIYEYQTTNKINSLSQPATVPNKDYTLLVVSEPDMWAYGFPHVDENKPIGKEYRVIAIDCEFALVKTNESQSYEPSRVSVVYLDGTEPKDWYISYPNATEVDYLEAITGIKDIDSKNPQTRNFVVDQVQKELTDNTILVGHSLMKDLEVLKLAHSHVIDTAVSYYQRMVTCEMQEDNGKFPSLQALAQKYLERSIQTDKHDSIEDAQAALDLAKKLFDPKLFDSATIESTSDKEDSMEINEETNVTEATNEEKENDAYTTPVKQKKTKQRSASSSDRKPTPNSGEPSHNIISGSLEHYRWFYKHKLKYMTTFGYNHSKEVAEIAFVLKKANITSENLVHDCFEAIQNAVEYTTLAQHSLHDFELLNSAIQNSYSRMMGSLCKYLFSKCTNSPDSILSIVPVVNMHEGYDQLNVY
jgi:DNA polymerase III epsilon subunit-like protein